MSEWKTYLLGKISTMKYGSMPKKELIRDEGFPIFSGYRISGYYEKFNCERQEIIIIARGVGGTGDVKIAPAKSFITNLSIIVKCDEKVVDKQYFFYKFQKHNLRFLDSGSAQSQITIDDLKRLEIDLPSLTEQKKVVSVLSCLDAKIENLRRQNETLEAIAQTLFKHWFIDFEFPNHEGKPYKTSGGAMIPSELGEIPEGWRVGTLGEIYDTTSGGTPSRKHPEYYLNGEIPWVKSKELYTTIILNTEEQINQQGLQKSSAKLLPEKSILIAMYGATVGQLSILGISATCNQAICAILEQEYPNLFVYFWLKYKHGEWTAMAIGSAQQNLSQILISKIEMIIPPLKIVEKFKRVSELLFQKILLNTKEIQTLTKTRDILLPKLMSGQLRVKDL